MVTDWPSIRGEMYSKGVVEKEKTINFKHFIFRFQKILKFEFLYSLFLCCKFKKYWNHKGNFSWYVVLFNIYIWASRTRTGKTQVICLFLILGTGLVRTRNCTNGREVKCFWKFKDLAWTYQFGKKILSYWNIEIYKYWSIDILEY